MCGIKLSILVLVGLIHSIDSKFAIWDEYYEVVADEVMVCANFVPGVISHVHATISYDEDPKGIISGNVTLLEDQDPIGLKLEIYQLRTGDSFKVFSFNRDNICSSKPLHELIHDHFLKLESDGENCKAEKGYHKMSGLSLEEIASTFLSNDAFHGKHKAVVQYYSPQGPVICLSIMLNVIKVE